MLPDRASNPGPLIYVSGALPMELRRPAYLLNQKTLRRGQTTLVSTS